MALFFYRHIRVVLCFVSRNKTQDLPFPGFLFSIAAFYCNFKTERALGDISCYVGQAADCDRCNKTARLSLNMTR